TISGTPTASGTFTYSIPLTGGCGAAINATGTITVDLCTGIEEVVLYDIRIYPNPASETLIIETANLEVDQVRLINILGETLVSDRVNNSIIKMNVSEFSMGVYFVQLVDTKGQVIRTEKVSIR
ncbi:T9SS type A sorting domain-containing protein, partial [Vicingus serpentipes]